MLSGSTVGMKAFVSLKELELGFLGFGPKPPTSVDLTPQTVQGLGLRGLGFKALRI